MGRFGQKVGGAEDRAKKRRTRPSVKIQKVTQDKLVEISTSANLTANFRNPIAAFARPPFDQASLPAASFHLSWPLDALRKSNTAPADASA